MKQKYFKILLYLASTIIVAFWGFVTPLFESPDEQVHLSTITYVADHGVVQPWDTTDTTAEMYKTQELLGTLRDGYGNNKYTYHPQYHVPYTDSLTGMYEAEIKALNNEASRSAYVKDEGAQYPIGYYLYSSWFYKLVNNKDLITRDFVVRLGSLPLAFLASYFTYQIGLLVFAKKSYARLLTAITFLQPMFGFVTAGINSDNLHNLLFFSIIYYCLKLIKKDLSCSTIVMLGLTLVADIYTKPQGFIALPLVGLSFLIHIVRTKNWKLLFALVITGLIVLIVVYPQLSQYLSYAFIKNGRGISLIEYLRFSLNKLVAQNVVWYWGVFKWLGVVLPAIYWRVANRVVLVSAIGMVVYLYRLIKKQKLVADPLSILFILFVAVYYAATIFWADWQHHKNVGYSLGIQARYFFPTLALHMALLITGITSFGWKSKIRRILKALLLLVFVWLQLGAIYHFLSIYYDVTSINSLIQKLSQYKPMYLKGSWWYLWGGAYLLALITLIYQVMVSKSKSSPSARKG